MSAITGIEKFPETAGDSRAKCGETIEFSDDYGDNDTTFHCGLDFGHLDEWHVEEGAMENNTKPYSLRWKRIEEED